MTIFAILQWCALALCCGICLYQGSPKSHLGAAIALLYTAISLVWVWPSSDPLFYFILWHGCAAALFLFLSPSRIGHYLTLLMAAQVFIDVLAWTGFIPAWLFPHLLGITYYALLILICFAHGSTDYYKPLGVEMVGGFRRLVRRCRIRIRRMVATSKKTAD